jgi:alkyl hydroperoxide reductase subunit AhpC
VQPGQDIQWLDGLKKAEGVVARQHRALRGLFIIDPNGILQYQVVHNLSVGRSTEEGLPIGGLRPEDRQG